MKLKEDFVLFYIPMETKRLSCIKNRLKQDIKPKKNDHVNMEHASFRQNGPVMGLYFRTVAKYIHMSHIYIVALCIR